MKKNKLSSNTALIIAALILLFALVVGVTVLMSICDPAGRNRDAGANGGLFDIIHVAGTDNPQGQGTGGDAYYPDNGDGDTERSPWGGDDDDDTPPRNEPNTLYYGNRSWVITNDPSVAGLKKHPAFQTGADDPTADRMCVILGHNTDKQFKCFNKIKVGAIIELLYDDTLYSYIVTDSITFDYEYDMLYPETTERVLIIVTCYSDDTIKGGKQVVYCKPLGD